MDVSYRQRGILLRPVPAAADLIELPLPARVTALLRQEAGPACKALVEVGEAVARGQRVGAGVAPGQADLHAPIAGVVAELRDLPLPDGTTSPAVVLTAGGAPPGGEGGAPVAEPDDDVLDRPRAELLDRLRRGGVVQGGRETRSLAAMIEEATSPLGYVSATGTPLARPIRALAVRFVDEDPHLQTLAAAAREIDAAPADLALGVQALKRISGASAVHFVLDVQQRLPAVGALADERDCEVHRIDTRRYPSASDVAIVAAVAGREPDVETHPVHTSGVLVVDADTVVDAARAVREQRPVLDRVLTVRRGDRAVVVRARLGASLAEVAAGAGFDPADDLARVVLGGPMRGMAHFTLEHPVTRGTRGLTLIPSSGLRRAVNHPCVGCGLCVEVCPMRLTPGLLSRYCEFGQWERAEEANLFSCIECGCCAWVCPAGRSMVHFLVHGKSEVIAMRRPA